MKTRINERLARVAIVLLLSGAWAAADGAPIRNDTIWKDAGGREIMRQGGSLCQFGDTFHFYGWADHPGDKKGKYWLFGAGVAGWASTHTYYSK